MIDSVLEQEEMITGGISLIDEGFSESNIPIKERPLRAAIQYVKIFVIEVSTGSKEDFFDTPWFAVIYHYSDKWYLKNYPALGNIKSGRYAVGVVLLRGIATQVEIPLTTSRVEKEGETAWLLFPTEIGQNESPFDWLIGAPNKELIDRKSLMEVNEKIAIIGIGLRRVRTNLLSVEPDDDVIKGLCSGILPALETTASHILKNGINHFQDAIWSLQMAYEKIFKALSYQKTGSFLETHDLFRLFDAVSNFVDPSLRESIKRFPRQNDVIGARYGQGYAPSLKQTYELYVDAVTTIGDLSEVVDRKLSVSNGGMLIKRAPWTRFQTV